MAESPPVLSDQAAEPVWVEVLDTVRSSGRIFGTLWPESFGLEVIESCPEKGLPMLIQLYFCQNFGGEIMETSIRKLKANARNARLSTGPKDTSRSRFNAAKHRILSSRVVVRTGDGKEDEEEFEEFSRQMWEDLAPAGVLEGSLVEDLINII